MPTTIDEGNLRFVFSDDWRVLKLDQDEFFRRNLMPLQLTKAVDFVGMHGNGELFLIEVKDFRGRRIELKNHEAACGGDSLELQLARKVKDSVSGIIGASRTRPKSEEFWIDCGYALRRSGSLKVVCWLEFDEGPASARKKDYLRKRMKTHADTRRKQYKKRLAWLTRDIDVLNQRIGPQRLPGVTVTDLGRVGSSP
jgi:hypothetical protein